MPKRKKTSHQAPEQKANPNPFYTIGRLDALLNSPQVLGLSRTPSQTVKAARAILAEYKRASETACTGDFSDSDYEDLMARRAASLSTGEL